MKQLWMVFAALLLTGIGVFGAETLTGEVSATEGLQLNGQAVAREGVRQWPVQSGDELRTAAPTVVRLRDGSRLVVGAGSQVRLEGAVVRVLRGSMRYELGAKSRAQIAVSGQMLTARQGVAAVGGAAAPSVTAPAVSEAKPPSVPPISRRKP